MDGWMVVGMSPSLLLLLLSYINQSRAPESAKVKAKMVYAGSKEAIKRALVGVGIHLNATDKSELEWDVILPSVKRFT